VGKANPHFTGDQCRKITSLFRNLKPRGPDEWTALAKQYNAHGKKHGWPSRNARSLKLKFFSFLKEKKPSGNPHRSDYIEEAIQAWRDFENQSHVRQLDDSENRAVEENGSQADFDDGDMPEFEHVADDVGSKSDLLSTVLLAIPALTTALNQMFSSLHTASDCSSSSAHAQPPLLLSASEAASQAKPSPSSLSLSSRKARSNKRALEELANSEDEVDRVVVRRKITVRQADRIMELAQAKLGAAPVLVEYTCRTRRRLAVDRRAAHR